jgi:hypothetical protein
MTQNYSPAPIYYTVSVSLTSPTNYSALTGTQAGGIDLGTAKKYNERVSVTGNTAITSNVMSSGETIVINGYSVAFASTDVLTDLVSKVNLASKYTNVVATNDVSSTFLTLTNPVDQMGYKFYVAEGSGTALSKLGIAAGTYSAGVTEYGSGFTNFISGDVISINQVNIAFSGSTSAAVTVNTINGIQAQTGVVASLYAGGEIQLGSVYNQPYVLGGANISSLGFTVGNHGGYPDTLALSQAKDQGNMRYLQAVMEIEKMATPYYVGSWSTTGNQLGNAAPTTLQFTVAFNNADWLQTTATTGEPDSGIVYTRELAIRRSVARALAATMNSNRNVFDPTLASYNGYPLVTTASKIINITATGWDVVGNVQTIENNITVTQIGNV